MTLHHALSRVINGEACRRKSWAQGYWLEYDLEQTMLYEKVLYKGNVLVMHKDHLHDRAFSVDDVLADDWEVIDDINDPWTTTKKIKDLKDETGKIN